MNNRELELWLRRATYGQKLNTILRNQWSMMQAQELEIQLELRNMLNLDKMNARVAKISDLAASVKAAYDGAISERDAARVERDAALANDATDQVKIDAAEANLAAAEALLETLQAVAAGTPVVLPPDTGASMGGVG